MSIRLRLTLLYTLILALTLVVFSAVLYTIQSRSTYTALQRDLAQRSEMLIQSITRMPMPPAQMAQPMVPPQPMPLDEFTGDPSLRSLPEREIVRILGTDGTLLVSPFGDQSSSLPLSITGLQALQSGKDWWETGYQDGEHLLIYSRPALRDGQVTFIVQVARSLTEHDRSLTALSQTLVIGGLVTVLVAFGIGWAFAGAALRPIHHITQTAQQIGRESNFSRRVDHRGPNDEIGQLATTFNSMLSRLQEAYRRVNHSLKMQRDFVADVSHELRTPLTTIRGNLDLLRNKPGPPADEQVDILNDLVDESERLIRLVNELLVFARADAGRNLSIELLEVEPLIEEACRQARTLAPGRQITVQVSPGLTLRGDRDALKQVLLILLDNALKHSEGDISVSAQQEAGIAMLTVRDQGPGIAPEVLEHVFDRFYRGDESTRTVGFGLGLPIARALVQAQGGTIQIESQVSVGSRAVIRLPA
jgi:signal transduction histidine kinase